MGLWLPSTPYGSAALWPPSPVSFLSSISPSQRFHSTDYLIVLYFDFSSKLWIFQVFTVAYSYTIGSVLGLNSALFFINSKIFWQVVGAVVELHRLESSGFTTREEAAFQRMCSVLANDLLPHINKCLRLLYPLSQISQITGIPVTQLQRDVRNSVGLLNIISKTSFDLCKTHLIKL